MSSLAYPFRLEIAMAKKQHQSDKSPRIVNRKARHEYHILETLEVGIALAGCEVKSIRDGQVSLAEGFAKIENDPTPQLYLYNVDIAPYSHAVGHSTLERKRRRKLLAHKRQILKLMGLTTQGGTTLIPLAMYFVRGKVKLEIGLAKGKKNVDKRQSIKSRDADREIRRGMSRKKLG